MIEFITEHGKKADIAGEILNQLPDWFGLPDSTKQYINDSRELPFWAYMEGDQPKGFIVLKETSPHTAEIYVMGVLKEYHNRKGVEHLFQGWEETLIWSCLQGMMGEIYAEKRRNRRLRWQSGW